MSFAKSAERDAEYAVSYGLELEEKRLQELAERQRRQAEASRHYSRAHSASQENGSSSPSIMESSPSYASESSSSVDSSPSISVDTSSAFSGGMTGGGGGSDSW